MMGRFLHNSVFLFHRKNNLLSMSQQTTEDEITLKEFITKSKELSGYILARWKIILLFGILGGLTGLTISLRSKPVYSASLTFVLDDQQTSDVGGAMGLANMLGFNISGGAGGIFSGGNLIELFKSRTMVEQTLLSSAIANNKQISFAEMYIQMQGWRELWEKDDKLKGIQFLPNADRSKFSREQDSIMGVIYQSISQSSLKIEQKDKRLDIITLEMQSGNENFAKYFAEALAKQVSDFYIATKSQKARINMDILEKQTDSVRAQLNAAISGVAVASDNIFGLNPALNVARVPSTKKQVDVQANTGTLMELIKQSELAKVIVRKSTPLIQVIDRPIFPLKVQRLGKLKSIIVGGFAGGLFILIVLTFIGILNVPAVRMKAD
jgi:uncharacterized protein involved in exopolysaccharide biosynthesis